MDAPVACTLTPGDFQNRAREIADLRQQHLTAVERRELVLELRYARSAAARVRAMVAAEQTCCAFLAFEIEETADDLHVTIIAPERARNVAEELFVVFGGEAARASS